ncbi:MAG: histidine phosphatase family protein [Gammaproteobacteria bacterium]|nr:histidine phosphatase family protein [Gammaproteobacteria bacterium]
MALTLLIFRHANSGWDAASDQQRSLSELGVQQAMFMGEQLKERAIRPDLVICSSAVRAKATMDLAMTAGEWECDSNITEALYNTTVPATLSLIKQFSDHDAVVMLIGHEPTWSELVFKLTASPRPFATAGMCCLQFSCQHWQNVEPGEAELLWYEQP